MQKILDGSSGLRERMTDPDRMPVSVCALFQLIEPVKNGGFMPDGVEEDVPPVGRQVEVPGGSVCLGTKRCPAVDKKEIIPLDDPQGLVDLRLALGKTRPHVVVHANGEGHLGDVFFDNSANTGRIIPLIERTRTRIESGVVWLHGLMQHHIVPPIGNLTGQLTRMGNPWEDGKGDGNMETKELPRFGDTVPDIVNDEGNPRT